MIVRTFDHPQVVATTYRAHGGGTARMIYDRSILKDILFLAQAVLPPGRTIEAHIDPYEEIYMIAKGGGQMRVDDEVRSVTAGESIWIPTGAVHELFNDRDEECHFYVVAGPMKNEF